MDTRRYAVIIEHGPTSFGAHVPDLPGCVAVGSSVAEVKESIRKAIDAHLAGMREDELPIPASTMEVD